MIAATNGRMVATTHLDVLPRMADFALFVTAASPALGWEASDFRSAYARNREDANGLALEASPIAVNVRAIAELPDG